MSEFVRVWKVPRKLVRVGLFDRLLVLGDDLLGELAGNLAVVVELELEDAAPLGD